MRCHGCESAIAIKRAEEVPTLSGLESRFTYRCRCGHEMVWVGRSRTRPAVDEPRMHRVGSRFGARGITGTVVG